MAVTTITPQTASVSGITPADAAANSDGSKFPNDGQTFLLITNGGGSSITVTVAATITIDGLTVSNLVVTVGAGAKKLIGPFDPGVFNDSAGNVSVTFSAVTSVTVTVVSVSV